MELCEIGFSEFVSWTALSSVTLGVYFTSYVDSSPKVILATIRGDLVAPENVSLLDILLSTPSGLPNAGQILGSHATSGVSKMAYTIPRRKGLRYCSAPDYDRWMDDLNAVSEAQGIGLSEFVLFQGELLSHHEIPSLQLGQLVLCSEDVLDREFDG